MKALLKKNFGYSNIVGRKITALCSGNYENFEVIGIKTGSGLFTKYDGKLYSYIYVSIIYHYARIICYE